MTSVGTEQARRSSSATSASMLPPSMLLTQNSSSGPSKLPRQPDAAASHPDPWHNTGIPGASLLGILSGYRDSASTAPGTDSSTRPPPWNDFIGQAKTVESYINRKEGVSDSGNGNAVAQVEPSASGNLSSTDIASTLMVHAMESAAAGSSNAKASTSTSTGTGTGAGTRAQMDNERGRAIVSPRESAESFLRNMPNKSDDPTIHQLWVELIRYRIRGLELEILEARRKEREAEMELIQLREGFARRSGGSASELDAEVTARDPQETSASTGAKRGAEALEKDAEYHEMGKTNGSHDEVSGTVTSRSNGNPTARDSDGIGLTAESSQTRPSSSSSRQIHGGQAAQDLSPNTIISQIVNRTDNISSDTITAPRSHLAAQDYQFAPPPGPRTDAPDIQHMQAAVTPTPFELEAMLSSSNFQTSNFDHLFSWLPDFDPSANMQSSMSQPSMVNYGLQGTGSHLDPNNLFLPPNSLAPESNLASGYNLGHQYDPSRIFAASDTHNQIYGSERFPSQDTSSLATPSMPHSPTFTLLRSHSAEPDPEHEGDDDSQPPNKRAKKAEKKLIKEESSDCGTCHSSIARILVRAPKSKLPAKLVPQLNCGNCKPVESPPSITDANAPAGGGGGIGTVETRKRMRTFMESEDEEKRIAAGPTDTALAKRVFCDVCARIVGSGRVLGDGEDVGWSCEIICASCDAKYQRCTDCGGGGGPRIGIGKWRMKQVFLPGRKTCSLSHSRLGDRQREIGVHVTPTDLTPEQLKEVLAKCKALWREKTISRLAVPEMLELDLPPHLINPIKSYTDVENIVTQNWPTREAMIKAEGADPKGFKRLLGLIWAHSRSRRSARTIDLEEEWQKSADAEDDDDLSTVLANVKRIIPAGTELIGMWGGEWDMRNGAILVSTFIPFEGTDGEDSTALSVGEMITKVQKLRQSINAGKAEADKCPPCEHLWVVSGGSMPLVKERLADILVRKRSFVHVEEYLTRHPEFIHALKARPYGMHPDLHSGGTDGATTPPQPLILVRWLGKDFDAQKILEIKQAEFGGKGKLKKRPKSRM